MEYIDDKNCKQIDNNVFYVTSEAGFRKAMKRYYIYTFKHAPADEGETWKSVFGKFIKEYPTEYPCVFTVEWMAHELESWEYFDIDCYYRFHGTFAKVLMGYDDKLSELCSEEA